MKRSAVVLHAMSGALGHASLASAYTAVLNANGYTATAVDVLARDRGFEVQALIDLHYRALYHAPSIWRALYAHWSSIPAASWLKNHLLPRRFARTCQWLRQTNPPLIVTTHPLATIIASYAKAQRWIDGRLLVAFANWHFQPFWMSPHVDGYLVVTGRQAHALAHHGVPSSQVSQVGLLVDPFFYQASKTQPVNALRVANRSSTILVMSGGTGWRIKDFLNIVSRLGSAANIYIAGVPASAMPELQLLLQQHPPAKASIQLLGIVDVRPYYSVADLFIGKPAISVAESVAMGLPCVVGFPVPGHDECAIPELLATTPAVALPTANPTAFLDSLIASLPDWRLPQRVEASNAARQCPARVLAAIRDFSA